MSALSDANAAWRKAWEGFEEQLREHALRVHIYGHSEGEYPAEWGYFSSLQNPSDVPGGITLVKGDHADRWYWYPLPYTFLAWDKESALVVAESAWLWEPAEVPWERLRELHHGAQVRRKAESNKGAGS